jgi:hypothetical protein
VATNHIVAALLQFVRQVGSDHFVGIEANA